MNKHTCIHFNGVQNPLCNRKVAYEQFRPGIPCIKAYPGAKRNGKPADTPPRPSNYQGKPCPFYEEPTTEQIEQDEAEWDKAIANFKAANIVAGAWRVRPKPRADRYEVVECPVCKGKLHLSQSAYNGHVHGKCETAGCVSWME